MATILAQSRQSAFHYLFVIGYDDGTIRGIPITEQLLVDFRTTGDDVPAALMLRLTGEPYRPVIEADDYTICIPNHATNAVYDEAATRSIDIDYLIAEVLQARGKTGMRIIPRPALPVPVEPRTLTLRDWVVRGANGRVVASGTAGFDVVEQQWYIYRKPPEQR